MNAKVDSSVTGNEFASKEELASVRDSGIEIEFASKEEVASLSNSVDSMLENVNRIMCKGVPPNLIKENGVMSHQAVNGFPLSDAMPCPEGKGCLHWLMWVCAEFVARYKSV